jgi:hypothetical protein
LPARSNATLARTFRVQDKVKHAGKSPAVIPGRAEGANPESSFGGVPE